MASLEAPIDIGGVTVPNRLYRAPLLECAGNGPDAVDRFISELEPTAASGVGLIFQGGEHRQPGERLCGAEHDAGPRPRVRRPPPAAHRRNSCTRGQDIHPARTRRAAEPGGVARRAPPAESRHLPAGGLPAAVATPNAGPRWPDRPEPHVLSTSEVYGLAEQFGRCASFAADAGTTGFTSPGRTWASSSSSARPLQPARTTSSASGRTAAAASAFWRSSTTPSVSTRTTSRSRRRCRSRQRPRRSFGGTCREPTAWPSPSALGAAGYDALVPVEVSPFWDMSVVRGRFPTGRGTPRTSERLCGGLRRAVAGASDRTPQSATGDPVRRRAGLERRFLPGRARAGQRAGTVRGRHPGPRNVRPLARRREWEPGCRSRRDGPAVLRRAAPRNAVAGRRGRPVREL